MASHWTTRPLGLFQGGPQVENFREMASTHPARVVRRAAAPAPFEAGTRLELPATFEFEGQNLDTAQFLAEIETTGLLVVRDGRIVFERYWLGNDATTQAASWSVGKSFVSALVGVAVDEGAIRSIEDPVTRYAPSLEGGAYDGVRIKDVLQMSSGARWNEDYSDPNSDINRWLRILDDGGSLDAFAAGCVRACEPGTFNRYNTTDTHVLGMVVRGATGRSLTEYLREKLWNPLGAEADAFWVVDSTGVEVAGGGLNAVLRDYARLGELYRNGGVWNGRRLLSEGWVRASVTPDAPHLMPGSRPSADHSLGYGFQWWVPSDNGAYTAIGVYNQYVCVDPATRTVIAQTAAFRRYAADASAEFYRVGECLTLFRAIADA
ncbi:MAG TPA: serine hydrolase [Caulobacteraceae bacterium]|nr:serine hydrolase [Caulobacteraceae bacterium]